MNNIFDKKMFLKYIAINYWIIIWVTLFFSRFMILDKSYLDYFNFVNIIWVYIK